RSGGLGPGARQRVVRVRLPAGMLRARVEASSRLFRPADPASWPAGRPAGCEGAPPGPNVRGQDDRAGNGRGVERTDDRRDRGSHRAVRSLAWCRTTGMANGPAPWAGGAAETAVGPGVEVARRGLTGGNGSAISRRWMKAPPAAAPSIVRNVGVDAMPGLPFALAGRAAVTAAVFAPFGRCPRFARLSALRRRFALDRRFPRRRTLDRPDLRRGLRLPLWHRLDGSGPPFDRCLPLRRRRVGLACGWRWRALADGRAIGRGGPCAIRCRSAR